MKKVEILLSAYKINGKIFYPNLIMFAKQSFTLVRLT